MKRQSFGLWSAFFLAALLLVGSALAAYQEVVPYLSGGRDAESKRQALSVAELPIGLSLQAQRLALDDCLQALTPLIGTSLSEENLRVADNCRAMAQDIVSQSPLFSYGWFILAMSFDAESQPDDFQKALAQSQVTTENQWAMASLRLWLGYQRWVQLTPDLREKLGHDIQVVATTNDGRTWLAARYQENEGFREDVISNLEKTSANTQRAFVRALSQSGVAQ
ncbi:hypothetical protein VW35_19495 [Devosia soli]|uniref:Uncharacterized protein n=1 Tax=Devosia soli TaxID=361041 RepID=A0A0F5L0I0_9HYPH|nr:hypothetical protein [Devosia soli]KKB75931.1 hypothetical protein VW35_19495 [Devosia soli]